MCCNWHGISPTRPAQCWVGRLWGDVSAMTQVNRAGQPLKEVIGSKTTHVVCCPTCKDARRIREENVVPFRGIDDAIERGFRPCKRCQPFAA